MLPGDVEYVVVTIKNSAGAAVTGLVTANFTVDYYLGATTPTSVFTVTEISGGRYRVALTLPGTTGYFSVFITQSTNTVENGRYHGELEDADADSIYSAVIRPQSQLAGTSALASEVTININARRYKALTVSVVDQAGAVVDLSGFNNWRWNVWDKTHTGSVYTQSTGITGSAGGVVAWAVAENAAFNSFMDTAIIAGDSTVTLYYDMLADRAATASQTEAVFRGQLVLTRWEGSA